MYLILVLLGYFFTGNYEWEGGGVVWWLHFPNLFLLVMTTVYAEIIDFWAGVVKIWTFLEIQLSYAGYG